MSRPRSQLIVTAKIQLYQPCLSTTCIPMEDSFRLGTGATRGSSATRFPLIIPNFRDSCWTAESLVSVEALEVVGAMGSLGVAMGVGMMCGGRGIPRARLLARVLSRLSEELL